MNILILGGSRFVGSHLVREAQSRGHDVTIFNRGQSASSAPAGVKQLIGNRDNDLSALAGTTWDATVDLSGYVPRHVREIAELIGNGVGFYQIVSSTAVYAPPETYGFTEDQRVVEPEGTLTEEVTDDTYGLLKVLCERQAMESFAEVSIVRPTYIVGPGDYTARFTYWVTRIAAGGDVLVPGPEAEMFQWIDVRDLATWMVTLVENRTQGTFHAAAPFPPATFADFVEGVKSALAVQDVRFTWVDRDFVLAAGLSQNDLPLWPGANPDGIVEAADSRRAEDSGLSTRSLADTVLGIYEAEKAVPTTRPTPVGSDDHAPIGLTEEKERALLKRWALHSKS